MTNEEAMELFREYRKTGDIKLRNKLIENYMYVAEILAKKFTGRGVEYDDLLQIASEALIKGVDKFDPDKGNMFTTYVTPTITGFICNYFRDYSRSVRVPRKLNTLRVSVKSAVNDYYRENGVKPTVKQLSAILHESEEDILEAMEYKTPVSLDTTVRGEDNDMPLYDVIADDDSTFERFISNESVKAEVEKLTPEEKLLVKLRYLENKSQAETGKEMGVSQMFISRMERRITKKLREALQDD
ncbi:MAG: sigma-70 family RNA polymerase sigma factor [Candidatus Coproplasma sp.]